MPTGSVERCHVCKTANALELFANLHCDTVPDTAPDCSLTTRGRGSDFFQHCPEHSNCLTITKKGNYIHDRMVGVLVINKHDVMRRQSITKKKMYHFY